MALWGKVPLQAVVSRGVVALWQPLKVASWGYVEEEEPILIKTIYRPMSGVPGETVEICSPLEIREWL
jgi:hypothetical protein